MMSNIDESFYNTTPVVRKKMEHVHCTPQSRSLFSFLLLIIPSSSSSFVFFFFFFFFRLLSFHLSINHYIDPSPPPSPSSVSLLFRSSATKSFRSSFPLAFRGISSIKTTPPLNFLYGATLSATKEITLSSSRSSVPPYDRK